MRTDRTRLKTRRIFTVEEWLELSRQPWFTLGAPSLAFLGPMSYAAPGRDRSRSNATESSRNERGTTKRKESGRIS